MHLLVIQIPHQAWLFRKGDGQVFGTEVCFGNSLPPGRERDVVYVWTDVLNVWHSRTLQTPWLVWTTAFITTQTCTVYYTNLLSGGQLHKHFIYAMQGYNYSTCMSKSIQLIVQCTDSSGHAHCLTVTCSPRGRP